MATIEKFALKHMSKRNFDEAVSCSDDKSLSHRDCSSIYSVTCYLTMWCWSQRAWWKSPAVKTIAKTFPVAVSVLHYILSVCIFMPSPKNVQLRSGHLTMNINSLSQEPIVSYRSTCSGITQQSRSLSYVGEICIVQSLTSNYHSVSKYTVNEVYSSGTKHIFKKVIVNMIKLGKELFS